MDHVKAILIKLALTGIVLYSILGVFGNASFTNIFIITILVTGAAYLIGDLYILKRFGNIIATIADFGLSFISIWLLGSILFGVEFGLVAAVLFSAVLLSCGEALFHIYMQNRVFHEDEEVYIDRTHAQRNLQTEFAEENPEQDYLRKHTDQSKDPSRKTD